MDQNLCYDKTWTESELQKIEKELHTLTVLQQLMHNSILESPDNIEIYAIKTSVQKLKTSLQATKKSLQFYMDSMENKLFQMNAYFEEELQKSNDLFSDR